MGAGKSMGAFLAVMLASCSTALVAEKPSDEMKAFLAKRQEGDHDIRLKGLERLSWTREAVARAAKDKSWETWQVPYPKRTADYFRYTVYRQRDADNAFVVIKTGGFAGVFEVYGTRKIKPPPLPTRS